MIDCVWGGNHLRKAESWPKLERVACLHLAMNGTEDAAEWAVSRYLVRGREQGFMAGINKTETGERVSI